MDRKNRTPESGNVEEPPATTVERVDEEQRRNDHDVHQGMTDEPHPSPNPLACLAIVNRTSSSFFANGPLDRLTRDTDFRRDVDQLIECKATIGGGINKIVEARRDIDDVSHFVTWEPPLLLLVHERKCTRPGRSLVRQVNVDDVEVGQLNRAISGPQVGRSFLIARDAGSGRRITRRCPHISCNGRHLGEAPQNHA